MPLVLNTPAIVAIENVAITEFTVRLGPVISVDIQYARSTESGAVADYRRASFGPDEIDAADTGGRARSAIKAALYTLLETVVGAGVVE